MEHTINLTTTKPTPLTVSGNRYYFNIGDIRHAFIVHDKILTHERSGSKVTILPAHWYASERSGARKALQDVVEKYGAKRINLVIAQAPTINPAS